MIKKQGFTLIEILIAIGILAILSAIVIIAINPARQFAQARNTQRWSDVNTILNAVHQNMVDNSGNFDFTDCGASSIPATTTIIKSDSDADLCDCLTPTYMASMVYDPSDGSYTSCDTYDSGYTILQNATTSRITIDAPSAELDETISITR